MAVPMLSLSHMVARLARREQYMEGVIIAGVDPSQRAHEEREDFCQIRRCMLVDMIVIVNANEVQSDRASRS